MEICKKKVSFSFLHYMSECVTCGGEGGQTHMSERVKGKSHSYRKMIETRPRWRASFCGQTCRRACRWQCHQLLRQWGKSSRLQSWDISFCTRDSTRCSMYCPGCLSCYIPTRGILSSLSCLQLQILLAVNRDQWEKMKLRQKLRFKLSFTFICCGVTLDQS